MWPNAPKCLFSQPGILLDLHVVMNDHTLFQIEKRKTDLDRA